MSSISPEAAIALTAGKALAIDRISGGGEPEWTAQDAAHAAKDLERRAWYAGLYKYAGDDSVRSALYGGLLNATIELKIYEQWPDRVMGEKYLERLVWLAIAEEKFPIIGMLKSWPAFVRKPVRTIRDLSAPGTNIRRVIQQAVLVEDDEVFWNKVVKRYQGINDILVGWNHEAKRLMGPRLADDAA